MNKATACSAIVLGLLVGAAQAEIVTVQYSDDDAPILAGDGSYSLPELGATLHDFSSGHAGCYSDAIVLAGDSGKHYFASDLGEVGSTYFSSDSTRSQFSYGNGCKQDYDDPAFSNMLGEPGEMSFVLFGLGGLYIDDSINGYFQLLNVDDDYMRLVGYSFNTDLTGGITVRNIPAPGAVACLGFAGLAGSRRRRS